MDLLEEMLTSHGWYPVEEDEHDAYTTIHEKVERNPC